MKFTWLVFFCIPYAVIKATLFKKFLPMPLTALLHPDPKVKTKSLH